MSDGRWVGDDEFECTRIVEVNERDWGWDLKMDHGWSFQVGKENAANPPRVGASYFFGEGFGRPVRGIVMRETRDEYGVEVFYRTKAEEKKRHENWCDENKAKKKRDFERDRAKLDADYAGLPKCFQSRLDRFRAHCPDFRWEFEPYEMSVCVDAVKIATVLKTREAIAEWYKLPYEEQRKVVDFFDGHSGNSFGCAISLARAYVDEAYEWIATSHGALVPLVGCEAYGCAHAQGEA